MVTGFCEKLGWWDLEVLISGFSERLNFGVQKDILPLMQIPHIKAFRARALYNAGYKTIASIAAATPEEIGKCDATFLLITDCCFNLNFSNSPPECSTFQEQKGEDRPVR